MKSKTEIDLVEIDLDLLDDHPQNPRLLIREDVVDGIASSLNGDYPKQHALHVRPVGERYQILAGHHRKRAALKKGFTKAWCWVEPLGDEEAYMALATSNNQGELSPLEIGFHALHCVELAKGGKGKKGGLSEYAQRLGKAKQSVSLYKEAAEVAMEVKPSIQIDGLLDKAQHLAAIHALPRQCWQACVEHVVKKDLSAADTREAVKEAKDFLADFKPDKSWSTYLDPKQCAAKVFCGTQPLTFSRLLDLAQKVNNELAAKEQTEDLAEQWVKWLEENAGRDSWDMRKVQEERQRLELIAWDRLNTPQEENPSAPLILADPPWRYDFAETDSRQVENQYATADVDQIIEHIRDPRMPPIADDCVLFLWATMPKLKEALAVMEGWGFTYKTGAVWDKQKIGMGYWFRGRHELLLVGTRGNASPPPESERVASVFSEAHGKHSAKPECVYEWIEKAFPDTKDKRLEMYQRTPRPGWRGFGNEAK